MLFYTDFKQRKIFFSKTLIKKKIDITKLVEVGIGIFLIFISLIFKPCTMVNDIRLFLNEYCVE